jgi:hypothetical protein
MPPRKNERKDSMHILAHASLIAAIKVAAEREMTSPSEFVRRALLQRLRADGVDPAASASATTHA